MQSTLDPCFTVDDGGGGFFLKNVVFSIMIQSEKGGAIASPKLFFKTTADKSPFTLI